MMELVVSAWLEDRWAVLRDELVDAARERFSESKRRRLLPAQIVAELAGTFGDGDTAMSLIQDATDLGLFALHWLDKCPALAVVRGRPEFERARAHVRRRAEAILDAMYGDHEVGQLLETVRDR